MSYKDVSDRIADLDHMTRFALCASELPGILVTCTLQREPKFYFTNKGDCASNPHLEEFRKWKPSVFESLMRFVAVAAVALTPIIREGHELYWVCDQDDIVANKTFEEASAMWLGCTIAAFTGAIVPPHLVVPKRDMRGDRLIFEDMLSICDVAAGGIGEYLEQCYSDHGLGLNQMLEAPERLRAKAERLALWFGDPYGDLKRVALQLDTQTNTAAIQYIHWGVRAA